MEKSAADMVEEMANGNPNPESITNMKQQAGWIGSTSYAQPQGKGEYPGATCLKFWSIWSYNRYFKKNSHLLVIDVHYVMFLGIWAMPVVMLTNQLNPQELAEMQEVSREIEFAMAERRQKRQAAEEENKRAEEAFKVEEKRLADVGRRYEARVKHMRALDPTSQERKNMEKKLNAGDKDVLG